MKMVNLRSYVDLRQGLAINAGTAHLVSDKRTDEFIYPLLRIADMESGTYEKFISVSVGKSVIAHEEDIIYTRTGQIGLAFTGKHGVVHNNSFIVDIISDDISKDYLYTVLQSEFVRDQALRLAKNSVQPDLTHDMFKSIIIPLPNKDKQKKISEAYKKITQKIQCNEEVNDNLAA